LLDSTDISPHPVLSRSTDLCEQNKQRSVRLLQSRSTKTWIVTTCCWPDHLVSSLHHRKKGRGRGGGGGATDRPLCSRHPLMRKKGSFGDPIPYKRQCNININISIKWTTQATAWVTRCTVYLAVINKVKLKETKTESTIRPSYWSEYLWTALRQVTTAFPTATDDLLRDKKAERCLLT
jgi:hypothetical protein